MRHKTVNPESIIQLPIDDVVLLSNKLLFLSNIFYFHQIGAILQIKVRLQFLVQPIQNLEVITAILTTRKALNKQLFFKSSENWDPRENCYPLKSEADKQM